jgi:hypothetical protein
LSAQLTLRLLLGNTADALIAGITAGRPDTGRVGFGPHTQILTRLTFDANTFAWAINVRAASCCASSIKAGFTALGARAKQGEILRHKHRSSRINTTIAKP